MSPKLLLCPLFFLPSLITLWLLLAAVAVAGRPSKELCIDLELNRLLDLRGEEGGLEGTTSLVVGGGGRGLLRLLALLGGLTEGGAAAVAVAVVVLVGAGLDRLREEESLLRVPTRPPLLLLLLFLTPPAPLLKLFSFMAGLHHLLRASLTSTARGSINNNNLHYAQSQ